MTCQHLDGHTVCGATPTRHYLTGWKCADHSPAAINTKYRKDNSDGP